MTEHHTLRKSKLAITLDENTLKRLDELVQKAVYPNRSRAIQIAVKEKLVRLERNRFARECARLDPAFEKMLAEEGLSRDVSEWHEY